VPITTHISHWGDLRVCDAHVHFFSHSFYSALARQKHVDGVEALGPMLEGWEIPGAAADGKDPLAERWVAELNSRHIARACLIASAPGDEDSVAMAVAEHPSRFFGAFMLDPMQPDAAYRMGKAAASSHLHTVCLFPAMQRYSIADQQYVAPVLDAAAANRMAVFVHCGALSVGVRRKLGLPSLFDMRYSNPLDLHAVALRYPQVSFIVPHFGGGMLREALLLADLCPNVYLDTSSSNKWMRYEGLNLRTVFGRCLDVVGASRLLFGTDSSFFPRGWQHDVLEQQSTALYELGVKEAEARLILGGNLERLMTARTDQTLLP
jgi:uncharacterized protein